MEINLLEQLEALPLFPKFYWHKRGEKTALACAGIKTLPTPQGRKYGCSSFFFEPEVVLKGLPGDFKEEEVPLLLSRIDLPSYSEWEEKIAYFLQIKELEKIVLARRTTLHLSKKLSPLRLLAKLVHPHTTRFALLFNPERGFIGATPEHLYERKGSLLFTEALAGTKRDPSAFGEKEQREFNLVKKGIWEALGSFCDTIHEEGEDRVLQFPHFSHLYNRFSARLKQPLSDLEIIHRLHPTAAIAGTPRELAIKLLSEQEPFSRNHYASPIGWYDSTSADFAVAIRSAEVEGNRIHLYAGAGILAGSDPKAEWEELEAKISPFLANFSSVT